jgi:hypothetical protein
MTHALDQLARDWDAGGTYDTLRRRIQITLERWDKK